MSIGLQLHLADFLVHLGYHLTLFNEHKTAKTKIQMISLYNLNLRLLVHIINRYIMKKQRSFWKFRVQFETAVRVSKTPGQLQCHLTIHQGTVVLKSLPVRPRATRWGKHAALRLACFHPKCIKLCRKYVEKKSRCLGMGDDLRWVDLSRMSSHPRWWEKHVSS